MDETAIEEFTLFGQPRVEQLNWINKENVKDMSPPISPKHALMGKPKTAEFFTQEEKHFFMMGMKSPAKKGLIPSKHQILVCIFSKYMTISLKFQTFHSSLFLFKCKC
jgi:hypothetical protein